MAGEKHHHSKKYYTHMEQPDPMFLEENINHDHLSKLPTQSKHSLKRPATNPQRQTTTNDRNATQRHGQRCPDGA